MLNCFSFYKDEDYFLLVLYCDYASAFYFRLFIQWHPQSFETETQTRLFKSPDHFTCSKGWEEPNNYCTNFHGSGCKVDILMRHTLRYRACQMQRPSHTPNKSWNTESMASWCHGDKCPYRLLPVCGGKTRWASRVSRKWEMKRKMEVNYIQIYPGLGAAITKCNGQYWQAAKSHSLQWRAVLSQRLFASSIYMQKKRRRSKTKKLLESLIVPEESCVTCYSVQFAYLARSAVKHYRTKLLLQHWLWQLF